MKKSLYAAGAIVLAGFLVGSALASPQKQVLSVTTHATAPGTTVVMTNTIRGYIEEIVFDVPAGSQTGDVSLVTVSDVTTEAARTIASTNSITADTVMRPRWKSDVNTGGGAQGTEYGERFLLVGESVVFSLTNALATNVTWKCIIKFDDGK